MKKGFTLVELLAVIIVLGVIGLIATVTVSNELKENRESLYQIQIDNIKRSAQNWASNHVFELPEEGESLTLTLGQLKQEGLSGDVVNPLTDEQFDDNLTKIKITKVENSYVYEVIIEENE